MKPALTYRESRVIETAREALAKCDYKRAKRTDPTPAQQRRALRKWPTGPWVLDLAARLIRRQA